MARLVALAALAALLALHPSAAQEEELYEDEGEDGLLEEAGFDATGQVLPPGSFAAATASGSTLRSAEPAHTWGLWYLQRRGDNLFVQSATTGARFVFVSDSNGWFYYSFNFDDFRTLFGAFTEVTDPEGMDPEWVISPAGAAALAEDASAASLAPLALSGTRLSLNGSDLQVLQVSDELPHLLKALLLARDGSARLLRNPGWALMGPWTGHDQVESAGEGEEEEQQQQQAPLELEFGEGGEEEEAQAEGEAAGAAGEEQPQQPTPPPAPRAAAGQGGRPDSMAARRHAAMQARQQQQQQRQQAFRERRQQQLLQRQQQRGQRG